MTEQILTIKQKIKTNSPLVHCITNPISINDCANALLAVGAKPIMAEHPKEVDGIVKTAGALAVNLGNITDARKKSILIAGKTANRLEIPHCIDVVGVGCSTLRLKLAKRYIQKTKPWVVKGDISEMKRLCGLSGNSRGIDAGTDDAVTPENISQYTKMLQDYAKATGAVILATGKLDLICSKDKAFAVENGTRMLSQITGTGCMLNVLIGACLTGGDPLLAAIGACVMLGIAGELAQNSAGVASFRTALLDRLSTLEDAQITENIKVREIECSLI